MSRFISASRRVFLLRFTRIALPLALQALLHHLIVFIDNLMVGQLGESSVAGVYIATRVHFFLFLITFGLVSGSTVSLGQFWGKRNFPSFRRTFGFALVCVTGITLLLASLVRIFPKEVLGIFSSDTSVLSEGIRYLRIAAFGYTIQAVTFFLFTVLRVTGKAAIPLSISAVGFVCNIALNAVLIFGLWIFPAMGVRGAALATLCSLSLQFLLALVYMVQNKELSGRIRDFLGWNRSFLRSYIKVTYPVVLNELGWSLGILVYDVVLGILGKAAQASYSVAEGLSRAAMVLFFGTAGATTVIFSTMIGAGKIRKVREYTKDLLMLSGVLGLFCMVALVSLAWVMPAFYNFEPATKRMLTAMIIIVGLRLPLRVINLHIIIGILRAGADTFFAMLIEVGTLWIVGVPMVACAGLVLGWSPPMVILASTFEELVKCIVGLMRLRSHKWIRQIAH